MRSKYFPLTSCEEWCQASRLRPAKMSTKTEPLEHTSVSRWLAELHMECYKKNLENFDTVQVSLV